MTAGRPPTPPRPDDSIWRSDEGRAQRVPTLSAEAASAGRAADELSARGGRRRPRRRRWPLGVAILLLILVLDSAYVAARLVGDLRAASSSLEQARDRFDAGDVDAAELEITEALERSEAALSLRWHPAHVVGSLFADFQAVTDVASAAEDVSRAGLSAVEAARVLGVSDSREIASTVYEDGRIRFDALEKAQPLVAAAAESLDKAAEHLAAAPPPSLGIVQDAIDEASDQVASARVTATNGSVLFDVLPSLLGREGPRTYLLAFQALGEARATGGVVGFYGVLQADDGRISLGHVGPVHDLGRTERSEPVDAPPWFERSYAPQFALRQALQANVSPRVPVVADVLLEMYEASTGAELDGVVFMDPITMGALLRSTGPIEVSGFEGAIGPENAAEVLLRRSYLDFSDPLQQNVYLGSLIREFWGRIEAGDLHGAKLARAVADQVSTKHLMVYAQDPEDQRALATLRADGDFTAAGGVVQQVFNNNYAVNKVDYFLRRTVETRIDLTADGDARVRTSVTLRNEAPSGPASLLLGPPPNKPKDPPGLNRMVLGFLLPKGAEPHQFFVREGADPQDPFLYSDSGRPVVWDILELLPGESRTVSTTYVIPDAIGVGPEGGDMRFVLWPQTRSTPDDFEVLVSPPEGFLVRGEGEMPTPLRDLIRVEGVLDREQEIQFHMERA